LLQKVEKQELLDELKKRKLVFFKRKMQNVHLKALLVSSGLIAIVLLVLIVLQIFMSQQINQVIQDNNSLREELSDLKENYNELGHVPLHSYPKSGLSTEFIEWEKLINDSSKENQLVVEQELSRMLSPFFGRTHALIFVDYPLQELSMTITSSLSKKSELSVWEKNVNQFLEDFSQNLLLTQCHFVLHLQEDEELSFEQTFVQNEAGDWEMISRQTFSNTNDSSAMMNKASDIPKNEQKGSVQFNE